jgi:hypothetical protein
LDWRETNYLLLRRGPYVIAAGMDESVEGAGKTLKGKFVNLFNPELKVLGAVSLEPGSRMLLLDLDSVRDKSPRLLASACKALLKKSSNSNLEYVVEGVGETPAILMLSADKAPRSVTLDGKPLEAVQYSSNDKLAWIRFENTAAPRELKVSF